MTQARPRFSIVVTALLAIILAAALLRLGALAAVLPFVVLLVIVLLVRPDWALAVAVGVPLLIEADPTWGPSPQLNRFYELLPGTKVEPVELCMFLAVIAGLLDMGSLSAALQRLGVMAVPLALLLLGLLIGAITGWDSGVGMFEIFNASRNSLGVFLVPIAVVCVVGRRVPLRSALVFTFVLAAVKALIGMLALFAGESALAGTQHITYYLAPANIVTMFALIFLIAAGVRRLRLPWTMWVSGPVIVASLVFSFRRSFWLGIALATLIVIVLMLGPRARRMLLPTAIVLVGLVVLTATGNTPGSGLVAAPTGTPSHSSLSGRLESINPTSISESSDDRYRLEERRNVLADLEQHPITGIGLGNSYIVRYPESISTIPHDYVHFAALWWWMKGGIAGLIGYVVLIATMVAAGVRIFRRHADPYVAVAGGAAAAATIGYALAELTATFAGPDNRSSIVVGALIGLLAVGWRESEPPPLGAELEPGPAVALGGRG